SLADPSSLLETPMPIRILLLVVACCLVSRAVAQDVKPMKYIDAHVHVWSTDNDRYPLAPGFKRSDIKPASFTPEDLLRHARPAGVGRIALVQVRFYGFD